MLYLMKKKIFMAMFHNDYIYEETKIVTAVHDIEFETVGKIELNKGWKSLFMQSSNDENNKIEADKVLPREFQKMKRFKCPPK